MPDITTVPFCHPPGPKRYLQKTYGIVGKLVEQVEVQVEVMERYLVEENLSLRTMEIVAEKVTVPEDTLFLVF